MVLKVVYEIFDSFQLLSLISFSCESHLHVACGGVAVGRTGLYHIRSTDAVIGHRMSPT